MAKVFLETGDDYRVINDNTQVYGSIGDDTDSVVIEDGAEGVFVNANVDRIDFAGDLADFTFKAGFGANMEVYAADGTTLLATIPLQDDEDGTQLVFADGAVDAIYDATEFEIGVGGEVLTDTAAAITPDAAQIDETVTTQADVEEPVPETPTFTLSADVDSIAEGDTTNGEVTFTISRDLGTGAASVAIQSTGGTALSDSDFTAISQTVEFADGETEKTVTLSTIADEIREDDETLTVTISNPSTGQVDPENDSVQITITNDDPNELPVLTVPTDADAFIGQTTLIEGISFTDADDNTGFTVTVSAEGTSQLSINAAANDGVTLHDASGDLLPQGEVTNTIVISGTKTNVNSALANLQYITNASTPGSEVLSIEVEDSFGGVATSELSINIGNSNELTDTNGDDLTGSSGNDIFTGTSATFQDDDKIDGGAGSEDKLILTAVGDGALAAATVENVEILDLTSSGGSANTPSVDGDNFSNDLDRIDFTASDTVDGLTIDNFANASTINVDADMKILTVGAKDDDTGSTDSVTVSLKGGVDIGTGVRGAVEIGIDDSTDDMEELTINSVDTNNAETKNTVANIVDTSFETVNVTGDTDLDITSVNDDLTTLDAEDFEGDLTVDLSDADAAVTVTTGAGEDDITASGHGDTITAGSGNDAVTGGDGVDTIDGGAGDDTINGAAGADVITGGTGADTLTGGAGNDTFVFEEGDSGTTTATRDKITDLSDGDMLDLTDFGTFGLEDGDELATAASADSVAEVYIDQTNNRIVIETAADGSSYEEIDISSNNVADALFTFDDGADDTVGTADDRILVGLVPLSATNNETGDMTVSGNAIGTPAVVIKHSGAPTLNGNNVGTNSVRDLDLSDLADKGVTVTVDAAGDFVAGEDDLEITGSAQNDDITAGDADDTIYGGAGDDAITGGGGADTLDGGAGADTFFYAAASEFGDTLNNFTTGTDVIALDVGSAAAGFLSGLIDNASVVNVIIGTNNTAIARASNANGSTVGVGLIQANANKTAFGSAGGFANLTAAKSALTHLSDGAFKNTVPGVTANATTAADKAWLALVQIGNSSIAFFSVFNNGSTVTGGSIAKADSQIDSATTIGILKLDVAANISGEDIIVI